MAHKIPEKLGSIEGLIRRFEEAQQRRRYWETHMRECYEYAIPHRETFNFHSPGSKKQSATVFDSTAIEGTQAYTARLQSTLVPPWRRFSKLAPGEEIPEKEREGIQRELDKHTRTLFTYINHSNFDVQAHESFLDLAVSTGTLDLNEGSGDNLLEFDAIPLASLYLEEGPRGTIETSWRLHRIPARNVKRLWPEADPSAQLTKRINDNPEERVEIIEGLVYEPEGDRYHNVVLERDPKHLVFSQTFDTNPRISFRESVVPGEVYGRGRLMTILPDIKTANKVVEYILRNAALAVGGIYTAVDDGVLNPYTVRLAPNSVIPVGSNANDNPSLRPLDRAGDFSVGDLVIEDLRRRINKVLMAEPFGDVTETPTRTATEVALRNQELLMRSGSAFGRLQTELVERVIKRAVDILQGAGKIPRMRVDGREVTIKHTSPLARAQDQEDILAFQQFTETLAAFGPEVTMLGIAVEDVPEWLGQKTGVDHKLLRNERDRNKLQKQVAGMIAAQQQAAAAAGQQGGGNG